MKALKLNFKGSHDNTIKNSVLIEEHELVNTINGVILTNMNGSTDLLLESIEEVFTKIKIITLQTKDTVHQITFPDGEVLNLFVGATITKEQRDKVVHLCAMEAKLSFVVDESEDEAQHEHEDHIIVMMETIVCALTGVNVE